MKKQNIQYNEWIALNESEKQELMKKWNPYEGEGSELLNEAFRRFKKQFDKMDEIKNMHCGIYHGGIYIIGVTVRKGKKVKLPKIFDGFSVMKFYDTKVSTH